MSGTASSSEFIKSVAKALSVISLMNQRQTPLTISEVSKAVGIPRASARRLLVTLEELGFLRLRGRHFSLTPRVLELSRAFQINDPLWGKAEPHLSELVAETGETASAGALDDLDVVYILRVKPQRSLHLALGPGTRLPAHASSMGRVLLGHIHPRQLESYFRRARIVKYTSRTLTDPGELKREVVLAGNRGYSIVNGEIDEGIIGIGVPVLDTNGQAVAALNLSASSARVTERQAQERLLPILMVKAQVLGRSLRTVHHWPAGPLHTPPPTNIAPVGVEVK